MRQRPPLIAQLDAQSQRSTRAFAVLPFVAAVAAGDLPRESYAGLLRALAIVYAAFGQELACAQHPPLIALRAWLPPALPLIEQDLAFFADADLPPAPVAALRAHLLTQAIRTRSHDDALLGYLYALAISDWGGLMGPQLAQAARLAGLGGAYVSGWAAGALALRQAFAQLPADAAQPKHAVAALEKALASIGGIIAALHPLEPTPPHEQARVLNPEAGSHAIPTDARELQAALRAGERSWQLFPYYEMRYGARGAQFTRSDSAWLVTLASYAQPAVDQQIGWLGRVLAARGMPRWMLEQHLGLLYAELVAAIPEQRAIYARLEQAAAALREQRCRSVSDQMLEQYRAAFDRRAGSEWRARLPGTGALLAAAVADERAGIAQAVPSLAGWLADPARFPQDWIDVVLDTIRLARQQVQATPPQE